MARIGFLGLGEMGTPMASRLLHAGHEVIAWNRTAERTAPLAQQGAAVASSPAKAAAGANVVITMLATPEALEQVLFGTDGLAAALSPGQVLIDMSTVGAAKPRLPGTAISNRPRRIAPGWTKPRSAAPPTSTFQRSWRQSPAHEQG